MKVKGKILVIPKEEEEISTTLDDNSWEIISKVSQKGTGDQYWDVGDCKEITLNGRVGADLTLSNLTIYVFILDFNHPINKTTPDNNIIWGGFKSALTGGKDLVLCESTYGTSYTSGIHFNINHAQVSSSLMNTNYGGWKGCDLRYDILGATSQQPSSYNTSSKSSSNTGYDATASTLTNPVSNTLLAALPNDFRSVLRLWNRYVDSVGNSSNTDANCSTPTVDAISFLSEYELYGARTYANQYEQNHQKQVAYYVSGNSKVRYRHNSTNNTAQYWTSSPSYNAATGFCYVNTNGSIPSNSYSRSSYGIAPVFKT